MESTCVRLTTARLKRICVKNKTQSYIKFIQGENLSILYNRLNYSPFNRVCLKRRSDGGTNRHYYYSSTEMNTLFSRMISLCVLLIRIKYLIQNYTENSLTGQTDIFSFLFDLSAHASLICDDRLLNYI